MPRRAWHAALVFRIIDARRRVVVQIGEFLPGADADQTLEFAVTVE
ncbi:MAG: hypothetical protein H6643_00395 [Caldilineaceae bacterium]|nr:hypothetical protein [Caldilineaceae bacterium]